MRLSNAVLFRRHVTENLLAPNVRGTWRSGLKSMSHSSEQSWTLALNAVNIGRLL